MIVRADPADAVFTKSAGEIVVATSTGRNFELIYTGKSGASLTLLYREYTSEDLVRPAFTQNLSYESDAKKIRFKNIQIEVVAATNERLEYRVDSD